jgi:hypothetical protein
MEKVKAFNAFNEATMAIRCFGQILEGANVQGAEVAPVDVGIVLETLLTDAERKFAEALAEE